MRLASFDSNTGNFKVTPYAIDNKLTHIEILTKTGTVVINHNDIDDLIDTLDELKQVLRRH